MQLRTSCNKLKCRCGAGATIGHGGPAHAWHAPERDQAELWRCRPSDITIYSWRANDAIRPHASAEYRCPFWRRSSRLCISVLMLAHMSADKAPSEGGIDVSSDPHRSKLRVRALSARMQALIVRVARRRWRRRRLGGQAAAHRQSGGHGHRNLEPVEADAGLVLSQRRPVGDADGGTRRSNGCSAPST